VRQVESTSSPESTELAEADSDFGESESDLRGAEQTQAEGGNPYLDRAKSIFERIKDDLKPERKETVGHVMTVIANLQSENKPLSAENLLAEFKTVSGRTRTRGISGFAKEFESATFHTLDEVMSNAPLDPAMERMKRGYAQKQFHRLKPFLKDSWKSSNPSPPAPPPMPTFGDIKSWTEHVAAGGEKPDWAGTTRLAMPKEVFDATHKTSDGKPKYPPEWMPLHLMPVWNYVAKKTEGDDFSGAYRTRSTMSQGRVEAGSQASFQEGFLLNAMRKYVQMRGGEDQLVDIPSSKLQLVDIPSSKLPEGVSHEDLFKGETDVKRLSTAKVFDPVGLMPFVKDEIEKVRKSLPNFSLFVKSEDTYVPGDSIKKHLVAATDETYESGETFKKSGAVIDFQRTERIEKIKSELRKRGFGA
jgi:hypothetical protein